MTTTDKERLTVLAQRLAAATATRAVEWQLADADVFTWRSNGGAVTIASRDRDGEPPYELSLQNHEQQRVDSLTSELLEDDLPAPWNDVLVELYRVARRSALRADEIIDALMAALPAQDVDEADRDRSLLGRARRLAPASSSEGT